MRAIIFANGEMNRPDAVRSLLHSEDVLIAADGGARHAISLGLLPHVIIGDLDSLTADEITSFAHQGVQIHKFSPIKDETDLELAIHYALQAQYAPLLIVGALGGRFDQQMGNLSLLTSPPCLQADVRLDDGVTETFFITSCASVYGQPGDTVSLIPYGEPVDGVITTGLAYPLHSETLFANRTRGISNEMLTDRAEITITRGLLLCVHIRK